ncbi:ribonuclease HI family protein [Patescibacteria group bacterium]|nr:ribonuclease HI family protein [Patescibacteria group bacterium]
MIDVLNIFTDGGARGNPGPSAIGVFIKDGDGKELAGIGKKIGISTNNIAEYKAVVEALDWIINNQHRLSRDAKIYFFLDSNLVYSQVVGLFKIKNPNLRELFFSIKKREAEIKLPIFYKHIPREQNREADRLVNMALDSVIKLA